MQGTQNATITPGNLGKISFWVGEHTVKISLHLAEWKWESHVSKRRATIGLALYLNIELHLVTYCLCVYEEKDSWFIDNLSKHNMVKVV